MQHVITKNNLKPFYKNPICDEVIDAMYRVGQTMPTALKETEQGGLAATPTGQQLKAKVFGETQK